jgi:ribosomal protein S18 acetylase RimI-like enzyme
MIEYRQARPGDAEAVALPHVRSWRENYRGALTDAFLDEALPEERLRVWHERLGHPPRNQFVQLAVDGAELRGFVCVYRDHDPRWGSFIDNLHVERGSKRSGIGSTLLRQAGGWLSLRDSGLGIYLWVLEANSSARRFYEHLGARNAGATLMETHGGATVRSCRYTWPEAQVLSTGRQLSTG